MIGVRFLGGPLSVVKVRVTSLRKTDTHSFLFFSLNLLRGPSTGRVVPRSVGFQPPAVLHSKVGLKTHLRAIPL